MSKLKSFIIYASGDVSFRKDFERHLTTLSHKIEYWADVKLNAGDGWEIILLSNLEASDIIFFLASSNAINTNFIKTVEIPRALNKYEKRSAIFIPIIIRPFFWEAIPDISSKQVLPKIDGEGVKPIELWHSKDEAWDFVIRKIDSVIEDILYWKKSHQTNTVASFVSYLKKFPFGHFAEMARSRYDFLLQKEFQAAKQSIGKLQVFIQQYPEELEYVNKARVEIERLQKEKDENAYLDARKVDTVESYAKYIQAFPNGLSAKQANQRIAGLIEEEKVAWGKAKSTENILLLKAFISVYPKSEHIPEARILVKNLEARQKENSLWEQAKKEHTIPGYKKYLKDYPLGKDSTEANQRIKILYEGEQRAWVQTKAAVEKASDWKEQIALYEAFQTNYPEGIFIPESNNLVKSLTDKFDEKHWETNAKLLLPWNMQRYLNAFPNGRHAVEAKKELNRWKYTGIVLAGLLLLYFIYWMSSGIYHFFTDTKSGLDPENFVYVEGGTFLMGSESGLNDEKPAHLVKVNGFKISKYELTWGDLEKILGRKNTRDEDFPIDTLNESIIQLIMDSLASKFPKHQYRLPTEEEWEYAARGGPNNDKYRFSGSDKIEQVAWYKRNAVGSPHEVGVLKPNSLGLYDMTGNVAEACNNFYEAYPNGGSVIKTDTPRRAIRGCSCIRDSTKCRVTFRFYMAQTPDKRGLRLVID